MPLRDLKHVDASELRAFQELPLEQKLDEIFLNGRETNGAVAEAQRDIEANRLTIESNRLANDRVLAEAIHAATDIEAKLDAHLKSHEKQDEQHQEQMAGINFIKRWGARGTAAIIAAAGAGEAIVLILHYAFGLGGWT